MSDGIETFTPRLPHGAANQPLGLQHLEKVNASLHPRVVATPSINAPLPQSSIT